MKAIPSAAVTVIRFRKRICSIIEESLPCIFAQAEEVKRIALASEELYIVLPIGSSQKSQWFEISDGAMIGEVMKVFRSLRLIELDFGLSAPWWDLSWEPENADASGHNPIVREHCRSLKSSDPSTPQAFARLDLSRGDFD